MRNEQLITLKDEDNVIKRLAIKERIYEFLNKHRFNYSVRELAIKLDLEYRQVQPRISELKSSGLIIIKGEKEEGTQVNSMYRFNTKPKLFGYGNKSKLSLYKMAVKSCIDSLKVDVINEEFERLVKLNG